MVCMCFSFCVCTITINENHEFERVHVVEDIGEFGGRKQKGRVDITILQSQKIIIKIFFEKSIILQ